MLLAARCTLYTQKSTFLWFVVVADFPMFFSSSQFETFLFVYILLVLRGGLCNRTQMRALARSTDKIILCMYRIGLIRCYYLRRTPLKTESIFNYLTSTVCMCVRSYECECVWSTEEIELRNQITKKNRN